MSLRHRARWGLPLMGKETFHMSPTCLGIFLYRSTAQALGLWLTCVGLRIAGLGVRGRQGGGGISGESLRLVLLIIPWLWF